MQHIIKEKRVEKCSLNVAKTGVAEVLETKKLKTSQNALSHNWQADGSKMIQLVI